MSTQYTGISPGSLPDTKAPDFTPRLRAMLSSLDVWARDAAFGMQRISNGQTPNGDGTPLGGVTDHGLLTGLADDDHLQYLLLAGRAGGQILLAADSTSVPLTIRGGSNSNISVQQWGDQANSTTLDLKIVAGATPAVSLFTDSGTGLNLTAGGAAVGVQITSAGSQFIGGKFGTGTLSTTPALLNVDSANLSAVVADSDDCLRIVRRSGTQTGYAIRLMDQTRTTTLAFLDAGGALSAGVLTSTSSLFVNFDSGTGFGGEIFVEGGAPTGAWQYNLPGNSGTIVVDASAVDYTLRLGTGSILKCNTASVGANFADTNTVSKKLRVVLSGAVGANALTVNSTAARNYQTLDVAGTIPLVGNTTSASGVLGKSDLTAQTASIGATTMLTGTTVSAGVFRVSFYMKTTTAGTAGDVVKATVAWNDGAAQTMDVPMLTTGGVGTNLDLGTNNAFVQGSVVVNVAASQNISYTTTVTKAGTPQYEIHARIEQLG